MAAEIDYKGPQLNLLPGCILTPNSDEINRYIKEAGNGHEKVDIAKSGLVIVHSDHQVDFPPKLHPRGSKAQYYVEQYSGDKKVFCHYLDPDQETSAHSHRVKPFPSTELHVVYGKLYQYREDIRWRIHQGTFDKPSITTIPPGIAHFAMTLDDWAVSVIVLTNARKYPEDQQHIEVPNQEEFKREARKLLTLA